MQLNALEQKFFDRILHAELDVPVPATLEFGNHTFKAIVVPEINPDGYFILRYYHARACDLEPETGEGGAVSKSMSWDEAAGQHPQLRQAWLQSEPVTVQLHPTKSFFDRMPSRPKLHPKLDARVHLAVTGHKGKLGLNDNQVTVQDSKLKATQFCIVAFPDFVNPRHPCLALDTKDGWSITLTKDEHLTRDHISHTGVIERTDGCSHEASDLTELLEGLKAFFGFTSGKWCQPTVVIGSDGGGQPVWGRIGKLDTVRQPLPNWFRNDRNAPNGSFLEVLFPLFWRQWRQEQDEVAAIVKCYVHSNSMQRAGFSEDAVAKSYAGLEMLAGLKSGKTIYGNSHEEIGKVLDAQIPHSSLDASKTPSLAKLYDNLQLDKDSIGNCLGLNLLNAVRNYVIHPLDKDKLPSIKAEYLKHLDADYMHYVFLHDLCQYYLEYMFLDYCNFDEAIADLHYRALIEERNLK